jgi:hypothetical protein
MNDRLDQLIAWARDNADEADPERTAIRELVDELEQLRALVAGHPEGWTAEDEAARLKSAGETTRELLRLRALVGPVAEGWMAERSHVVGFTHEARDALNALAAGWTS